MAHKSVKFYHGTDARIVRMKKENRLSFRETIQEIIDTLWPIYQPYIDGAIENAKYELFVLLDRNERLFDYVWQRLNYWSAQQLNSKLYQYQTEGIYVRKDKLFADNYANTARYFGEIGSIAFAMAFTVEKIRTSIELEEDFKEKINNFLDFCNKSPEPIVFEFDIDSPQYLIDENGNKVSEWMLYDSIDAPSWRLVKDVDLSNMSFVNVEVDHIHFDVNPYKYEVIPHPEIQILKKGDLVRINNDCGEFPKMGETCVVVYSNNNSVGIIPCHHNKLFEVPLKNICLLKRK